MLDKVALYLSTLCVNTTDNLTPTPTNTKNDNTANNKESIIYSASNHLDQSTGQYQSLFPCLQDESQLRFQHIGTLLAWWVRFVVPVGANWVSNTRYIDG